MHHRRPPQHRHHCAARWRDAPRAASRHACDPPPRARLARAYAAGTAITSNTPEQAGRQAGRQRGLLVSRLLHPPPPHTYLQTPDAHLPPGSARAPAVLLRAALERHSNGHSPCGCSVRHLQVGPRPGTQQGASCRSSSPRSGNPVACAAAAAAAAAAAFTSCAPLPCDRACANKPLLLTAFAEHCALCEHACVAPCLSACVRAGASSRSPARRRCSSCWCAARGCCWSTTCTSSTTACSWVGRRQ